MKLHPFRTVAAAMLMTPGVTDPPHTAMPAAVAPVPVAAAHLVHAAVAGEDGNHLDAHAFVILLDQPGFSADVEFPQDIDAHR